tara:strand:- start:1046 stop:1240 length:195 start_codon:yes stop_codon:yes gene_type:complete
MKWLLKFLGFKGSIGRKKVKLEILQEKAFMAQRNGDLSMAGKYLQEAELLETEIVNEIEKEKNR